MDNITHTLAGLLIGESLSRSTPAGHSTLEAPQRRGLLLALSVVSSNLPDADVLYTMAATSKLDYLSQHRGYSHTIPGILAGAVLLFVAVELWARWRRLSLARSDRTAIAAAVTISLALHIAMDYTNSYGVHPFWPLDNHWRYGDAVFIIEPLLWACAAPLVFLLRSVIARVLILAVLASALALSFGTRWVLPVSGLAVAALMLCLLFIAWKTTPRTALLCAVGAWLSVTALFFAESTVAGQLVAREFAQRYPGATLLDHVLSPMPANPICWNLIAVSLERDGYALRRAALSTAPGLIPAGTCPDRALDTAGLAPTHRIDGAPPAGAVQWLDEYRASKSELASVARTFCDAAIALRFARAPWMVQRGGLWTIGDLRYGGFATTELTEAPRACSTAIPPWLPPRSDLLR